jgi:Bacterial PH domain
MADSQAFPISGVVPPELAEARIREIWPSVARMPFVAGLGRSLTRTIVLAPLAWLVMSIAYFGKLMPVLMRRYLLTNRRLMVRVGWSGKPSAEAPLDKIDQVRVVTDANSDFFRAGTIEIVNGAHVILTLTGVPEPHSFRWAILNARNAWVPGKSKTLPFIPASATN